MTRRDALKIPLIASAASLAPAASPARLETEIVRLKLLHPWTTVMSSSDFRDTLHVRYSKDGITGHGEGAPIVRYKEDAQSAQQAVNSVKDLVASSDPWQFSKLMAEVFHRVDGQWAGKATIDIALLDWICQKLGVPIYRYFGLDKNDAPVTTISIGIYT